MSFEITDREAEEVHYTVGRKLKDIIRVLNYQKNGKKVERLDKLLEREPMMRELIERLESTYPNLKKYELKEA